MQNLTSVRIIPQKVPVLATVLYWLPDSPHVLAPPLIWQREDEVPGFPRLLQYLDHWTKYIEGTLSEVFVDAGPFAPPGTCRPYAELARSYRVARPH